MDLGVLLLILGIVFAVLGYTTLGVVLVVGALAVWLVPRIRR